MRIILFVMLALASSCLNRKPNEWRGIPEGVKVACSWHTDEIGACVGGGKAYTCIKTHHESADENKGRIIECARVSAPILPEASKEDE